VLVRCLKIISPFGDPVGSYPGMTVGNSYPVLEIFYSAEACYVRVVDDEGTDSLWDPEMFQTVDGYIPASWSAALGDDGSLRLAPKSWLREGFWTDHFAKDPVALAEYEAGRAAVLAGLTAT
jgi:hypothetical protein